jgi:hypothetical protein
MPEAPSGAPGLSRFRPLSLAADPSLSPTSPPPQRPTVPAPPRPVTSPRRNHPAWPSVPGHHHARLSTRLAASPPGCEPLAANPVRFAFERLAPQTRLATIGICCLAGLFGIPPTWPRTRPLPDREAACSVFARLAANSPRGHSAGRHSAWAAASGRHLTLVDVSPSGGRLALVGLVPSGRARPAWSGSSRLVGTSSGRRSPVRSDPGSAASRSATSCSAIRAPLARRVGHARGRSRAAREVRAAAAASRTTRAKCRYGAANPCEVSQLRGEPVRSLATARCTTCLGVAASPRVMAGDASWRLFARKACSESIWPTEAAIE